jgi:hypothetical protein
VKRHGFDPLSFIFGVLFMALAAVLSTGNIEAFKLDTSDLQWMGAALLLVIGGVMLLGSRSRSSEKS